jgi:heat-inducible transcriptional repressor
MKPLSRRQEQVLQATVHHYVDTMEPVGSRTLVQRFSMPASSATIRSAMGALEQRGLLTQPHTSSGRIPSALGYRHYVDCLLPEPAATVLHLERELTGLSLGWAALDDLLLQLARRLTDFTGLMSLITRPKRTQPQLEAIRLVQSGERLLVMLVENSGHASHLNLRLPHATSDELGRHRTLDRTAIASGGPELGEIAHPTPTEWRCAASCPRTSLDLARTNNLGARFIATGRRTRIPKRPRPWPLASAHRR